MYERARLSRDARFDGRFFVGVMTTGIYCRPICRARQPKPENVRYYLSAAAAAAAGLRPCRRCRPEAAPGSPSWLGRSATVDRALHLIADGALDEDGGDGVRDVASLAARFGLGERQLRRLFVEHVGATPAKIASRRRLHLARCLLEHSDGADRTERPLTEIAYAAGYGSVRRFNAAFREAFGQPPSAVRRRGLVGARAAPGTPVAGGEAWTLRLELRRPFDWEGLVAFLEARAIPGVETVQSGVYRRTFRRPGATLGSGAGGWLEVAYDGDGAVLMRLYTLDGGRSVRSLAGSVSRVRRLCDLDADPAAVAGSLSRDPVLAGPLRRRPGIRVPGCWDSFELVVRAVLGQQVTVRGATTLSGRLIERFGSSLETPAAMTLPSEVGAVWPMRLFPRPETLADAELETLGMPRSRADTLRAVARAFAEGRLDLGAMTSLEQTLEELTVLPGIGPWTAQYVAMRALGHPDAFPASDLGLRKALSRDGKPASTRGVERRAEPWRPWRAYAAMLLWSSAAGGG